MNRPQIFAYHDHLAFLKDWVAYLKATQSDFSLRGLARKAGLATGYLPMVFAAQRPLTSKALGKLLPFLSLAANEQAFLEQLLALGTAETHAARVSALERMGRFPLFQKHNGRDAQAYEYLTHWYHVAIREMAALPGFKLDAEWIRDRLQESVPLKEIQVALEFLTANGYLKVKADGSVLPPENAIDCSGGVYRIALGQYHRQIFELATRSIDSVPREEREIQGHTIALGGKSYDQARGIMEEAISKIRELGEKDKNSQAVYHMEVALFPLTRRSQKK